jgi:6,7-dimethyl-8-ribityllumazine synthase
MPRTFEGNPADAIARYAIVVSRYNASVTQRLLTAAVETLLAQGVADAEIDVFWTPGAFELPVIAARVVDRGYAAILCLGAVIRGETSHDQHINRAVSMELARLGVSTGVPVLFGVLTCESLEQALHRAGGDVGDKGAECALAALEMVSLLRKLP